MVTVTLLCHVVYTFVIVPIIKSVRGLDDELNRKVFQEGNPTREWGSRQEGPTGTFFPVLFEL